MATEVMNNKGFRVSQGTEVFNNTEKIENQNQNQLKQDTDFKDFITGKITMDELFKKKEGEDDSPEHISN